MTRSVTVVSLRAPQTTTYALPEEFAFDMRNCLHANELAMWALDSLCMATKTSPELDRAVFALHEAKFRFDALYEQFAAAEAPSR